MTAVATFILLSLVGISVISDLRCQKIKNELILLGWGMGIFYQVFHLGVFGIMFFILGAIIPVILLWTLFLFRMIGASDIKLLSVIGGFIGFIPVLKCIVGCFLIGALISAVILLVYNNVFERFYYLKNYIIGYLLTKERRPYILSGQRLENIHFSVPILMSTLLYVGGIY